MLVYFPKHPLPVTISEINLSLIKISNSIAPYDINILSPCVLYILNCYHMYSILNMSLAGFLTLKVCPAVRRTIHHFICLLGASSSARGGGGLPWLWAAQTSPTACSLCRSEEENARKVQRRHAFSHGQR